jgi:hypothetical protein
MRTVKELRVPKNWNGCEFEKFLYNSSATKLPLMRTLWAAILNFRTLTDACLYYMAALIVSRYSGFAPGSTGQLRVTTHIIDARISAKHLGKNG